MGFRRPSWAHSSAETHIEPPLVESTAPFAFHEADGQQACLWKQETQHKDI